MWRRILPLDYRRRKLLRGAPAGPLRDYLATPFADRGADYRDIEFVALDLETTGLDPAHHSILSVGMVSLISRRIDLSTAQHLLVKPEHAIPEGSAVIHRITDDAAAHGDALANVMPRVLARLCGRVMLVHHAEIERRFLNAACRQLYGTGFLVPVADTETLIRRWLERRDQPLAGRELRLHALRARYGLPRYTAHNALTDALATAELFCAFVANANLESKLPLKRFLEQQ
ncbi:MAG: 3'-5' exonuclease [Betaproteobacteria bacterium]|nr:MAG: 3'-5' exonuclease [Betaproteobacteria bacterium]